MSNDLVKDLRNSGWYFGKPAADRIEQLEAALNDMAQYVSQEDWDCFLKPETRKALEGTPEKSVYKEGYRAVEEAMGHPSPEFWIERKEN